MNVLLGSIFRNSTGYLDRYFEQVARLSRLFSEHHATLGLVLAEGDSTDGTENDLRGRLRGISGVVRQTRLIKAEHGGQVYGSIDHEQRWRNISFVCNALLHQVDVMSGYDAFLYVESDLIWSASVMLELIDDLTQPHIEVVAPLCIHAQTGRNYETWGHRAGGMKFTAEWPFHPMLSDDQAYNGSTLFEMDSAGSCLAMRMSIAKICRFDPPEHGIVGWCEDIRAHGHKIWLNPTLQVIHP